MGRTSPGESLGHPLDEVNGGIIVVGRDGVCTYANRQAHDMLGYSAGDLIGLSRDAFEVPGEDEDRSGDLVSMRRADGGSFPAFMSTTQHSDGVCLILFHDGTRLAEAVESQRRSETYYRELVEVTSDWIWEVDGDGVYTYASPKVEDLLGYTPEEVVGRTPFDFMPSDEAGEVRETFAAIAAARRPFAALENVNLHRDGHAVVLETSGVPVFDQHGEFAGYRGIDRDITARRRSEEVLERNRSALAEVERIASIGHWDWNIADGSLKWSDEIYRIFGLAREDFGATYEAFLEAVHPEDRGRVREAVDKAVHENMPYHIEHRVVRPDGSERIVEERGEVYHSDGRAVRILGTVQDITEKKEAETRLLQVTKVLENASEGVLITDRYARILAVNEAFTRVTGYREEEVQGRSPSILQSGRQDKAFYERMWAEITISGRWQGEIWNRRKNGELYPEWLTISALEDDNGDVMNYIAVFSDLSPMKRSQDQLNYLVLHDPLTGLPNRRYLMEHLTHVISHADGEQDGYTLMLIDVDQFEAVNETLGHECGDQLLRILAERMSRCVRKEDFAARLGGDEFALVLDGVAKRSEIERLIHKLQDCLSPTISLRECEIEPSACIGVSFYPADAPDPEVLLQRADAALHEAKRGGAGSWAFFSPELGVRASRRMTLVSALRDAVHGHKGLSVHYQPQVDAVTGDVAGVEALVRWEHPDQGHISPAHFIPLAEESGLIVELGEWILNTACADARRWEVAGLVPLRVAVNVSGRQILCDHIIERVSEALDRHRLDPGRLEIEITESTLMEDTMRARSTVQDLRSMGVTVAIDDFGTGYSSLSYLKRFSPDKLKIDKSFIDGVPGKPDEEAIVQAVISMAHSLRMQVTAEGVETEAQRRFLGERGCNFLQGYLFSKPMPQEALASWLKTQTLMQG